MKQLILILLCLIQFNTQATVSEDIKIAHEAILKLEQSMDFYRSDIHPLLEKLQQNPRYVFNQEEVKALKSFWVQNVNYRIVLQTLYNTYQNKNSDTAKLIKYTSNLQLNVNAAELSQKLWDNDIAHKKLDETAEDEIPRGSFISMENALFKQFSQNFNDEELPSFFPVYSLENDKMNMSPSLYLASDIHAEIEKVNSQNELKIQDYQEFLTSSANYREVRKRFFIYKFKNLFFTIMKKIGTWLGSTKVKNRNPDEYNGQTYIDLKMAKEMDKKVQPGDIMLSKTEWFLSNVFLPGFWPHSFLYIGDYHKLRLYFMDREVTSYFQAKCVEEGLYCTDLTSYLELSETTKDSWKAYRTKDKYGFDPVLIEATKDGVHFSSIRLTFFNDHLAAVRPKVSKLEKALAIVTAMSKNGLEYDYDFDFQTDDRLVCSELVAKSYMKDSTRVGINFNYDLDKEKYLELIMGRMNLPVINIVHKLYDEEYLMLRSPELEFVAFLKGNAKTKKATFKNKQEFIKTRDWKKWSFMDN